MIRQFATKICLILTLLALSGCFHSSQEAQRWTLQPDGVTSFSLSREGRFALVASTKKGIELWDLMKNKKLADFGYQDLNNSTVTQSQISDNNRYAVTATSNNFAVWDLAWGQSEGLWSISDGIIRDVDISNNGQKVLIALSNRKALFIDLGTGRRIEFLAHKDKVNSVSISPNGKFAMSGGNDHNVFLWSTESGQILKHFPHNHRITRVVLHRSGKYAFSADGDDTAIIWDLATGEERSKLQMFQRHPNFSSARFSDDGDILVTGTPGRRIESWDTKTGDSMGRWLAEETQNTRPPSAVVYDVAIDPTGRVISGTSAGIAQAWIAKED